jgi:trehalose 6-phosphate phosphatase
VSAPSDAFAAALERLARSHILLTACDFDGTLAPIVDEPDAARPLPGALTALERLAALPGVAVAVVSGRSVADLRRRTAFPPDFLLVGSHGAEIGDQGVVGLDDAGAALHRELRVALEGMAAEDRGFRLEVKPASLAFHFRMADPARGEEITARILRELATRPGVRLRRGKKVLELLVAPADKGDAVRRLRARTGADAVLYVGDDLTDEDAFAALGEGDLGVKVGPGETRAAHRVEDPVAVVGLLELLAARRAQGGSETAAS